MAETYANSDDVTRTILLLNYMKAHGHSIRSMAKDIGMSPNTLYYLRSTSRASAKTCFYIQEKIKEVYPEDYKMIMDYYGEYINRRYGW